MRYYQVKIERSIVHPVYVVRALNIPEAHDKALKVEEQAARDASETTMPRVQSIVEFLPDDAVLL